MAQRQPVSVPELFRLWHNGTKVVDICAQLQITESKLRRLAQEHKLPKRPGGNTQRTRGVDPTPEELEALLAETRQKWSPREAETRYVGPKPKPWEVPTYHVDSQTGAFYRE